MQPLLVAAGDCGVWGGQREDVDRWIQLDDHAAIHAYVRMYMRTYSREIARGVRCQPEIVGWEENGEKM